MTTKEKFKQQHIEVVSYMLQKISRKPLGMATALPLFGAVHNYSLETILARYHLPQAQSYTDYALREALSKSRRLLN